MPNVDLVFPGNTLQNGADAVALYLGSAADFPANTPVTATNRVNAVVYDTSDADDSGLLAVLMPGQPQLDERIQNLNAREDGVLDGVEDQRINGGSGNNTLAGGAGDDDISGGSGNDGLSGNGGSDELDGGSGNDVLDGGAGGRLPDRQFGKRYVRVRRRHRPG